MVPVEKRVIETHGVEVCARVYRSTEEEVSNSVKEARHIEMVFELSGVCKKRQTEQVSMHIMQQGQ